MDDVDVQQTSSFVVHARDKTIAPGKHPAGGYVAGGIAGGWLAGGRALVAGKTTVWLEQSNRRGGEATQSCPESQRQHQHS